MNTDTTNTTRRALIGALPALAVAPAAATAGEPDPVFALLARVREAKQEYDDVKALADRIWEANKARVGQEILAREPTCSCFVEAVTVSRKFLDEKCMRWIAARSALASQPPATVAGAIAALECGGVAPYGDQICANAAQTLRRLTGV